MQQTANYGCLLNKVNQADQQASMGFGLGLTKGSSS